MSMTEWQSDTDNIPSCIRYGVGPAKIGSQVCTCGGVCKCSAMVDRGVNGFHHQAKHRSQPVATCENGGVKSSNSWKPPRRIVA